MAFSAVPEKPKFPSSLFPENGYNAERLPIFFPYLTATRERIYRLRDTLPKRAQKQPFNYHREVANLPIGLELFSFASLLDGSRAPRQAVIVPKTITAATSRRSAFRRSPSKAEAKSTAQTGCANWIGATRTRPPRDKAHSHERLAIIVAPMVMWMTEAQVAAVHC
jgi:hypothetical protein